MNGQEKDDEIAEGIYTAEYWEYDSRLGRRWNTDPVVKLWESPYACFSNNPIYYADPTGSNTVTPVSTEVTVVGEDLSGGPPKSIQATSLLSAPPQEIMPGPGNGGGGPAPKGTPIGGPAYSPPPTEGAPPRVPPRVVGPAVGAVVLAGVWYGGLTALGELADRTDMSGPEYDMYGTPRPLPAIKWNFEKEKDDDNKITLYRGVNPTHPDYQNALKGIATPLGGNTNPRIHNEGTNTLSIFTSWTTDRQVASQWATVMGTGGVVLEKEFNQFTLIPSPDIYNEKEVLVPGVVTGARVTTPGKK